jgi:transposase-like protein
MIYERRSRLSGKQQRRLIDLFVAGATARAAAELAGVNRNTARTCYHRLRQLIASKLPSYDLSGEVEADESSFEGFARATVAEQRQARCPYGACSNEAGGVYRHYAECPVENVAADHSRAGATGQHRLYR